MSAERNHDLVRGLLEPEGEGTITRSEYRRLDHRCGQCGAPLIEAPRTDGTPQLVCSVLVRQGYHRDRAE